MLSKLVKYLKSIIRICILKIRYRKAIQFKLTNLKSLYIGKSVVIEIDKGSKLVFGEGVYIDDYCRIKCKGGEIYIGNDIFMNSGVKIVAMSKIIIGDLCIFGPGVSIYDHDHSFNNSELPIKKQGFSISQVKVGKDVWFGSNAVITKGVQIVDRCIIGANSVVTKNIDKSGIYGGIPSKFIKNI